ncbi:MAG: HAD family hydrolase [Vicinamibacterales bacterium]|nr:HAD family hydrolase [Vicinamibacterales bacterium]
MRLLLFDVDGTLVLTGGAGMRGMTRAFETVFGVPDALNGIPVAGRTDPAILAEMMSRAGITADDAARARFQDCYLPILAEEMNRPVPDTLHPSQHSHYKGPLPGVPELVGALDGHDGVFLALLTGNYTRAAEIKLGHFDLWQPFRCGAFGDDGTERHELVPVATARALALGCPAVGPDDVIVIGDTPLDVACARTAGVRSLAVATGGYSRDVLEQSQADLAVDALTDTKAMVQWLTRT